MSKNEIENEGQGPAQPQGGAASPPEAPAETVGGTLGGGPAAGHFRSPLREMLMIAAPSVATMASYTVMQFADMLMVSRIGPEPIYVAAQGNAGIVTWTLMTFSVGVSGVVSSFVSQNLGAGKPERGAAYAWNGMWLGALWWIAIMLPAALIIPRLYGMTDHAPEVIAMETSYARIAMAGAVFTLTAKAMHNYFFGLHKPGVVMVSVVAANITNIFASMVLVFGETGMPLGDGAINSILGFFAVPTQWVAQSLGIQAMGLEGAAWGTVLGTAFEFVIPFAFFLGPKSNAMYSTRKAWRWSRECVRDLMRIGWPAGTMFVNELICWSYLTVVLLGMAGRAKATGAGLDEAAIAEAGTVANTAGYIALQFMHLSFMPTVGLSIATQAMVGKAMGAGKPELARAHAMLGLKFAVIYMGLCAVAFVIWRREAIGVFLPPGISPEGAAKVVTVGALVMIAAAVFQVFDAVAIILSAALRGAGDTIWPGVVGIILSWGCVVGLGRLMVEVAPQMGSVGPWAGASIYIILLSVAMVWRFAGGAWKTMKLTHTDDLHNLPPDAVAPGPAPETG
ncbi:MAG: MATE family multidrug resistance protein [Phycisphaerales bacterium]|jgi:MATE family multidrug resistance protein